MLVGLYGNGLFNWVIFISSHSFASCVSYEIWFLGWVLHPLRLLLPERKVPVWITSRVVSLHESAVNPVQWKNSLFGKTFVSVEFAWCLCIRSLSWVASHSFDVLDSDFCLSFLLFFPHFSLHAGWMVWWSVDFWELDLLRCRPSQFFK